MSDVQEAMYEKVLTAQKKFFRTGETKDVGFRVEQLMKLRDLINSNKEEIIDALNKDLNRHPYEGYITEIATVLDELNIFISELPSWAADEHVGSPLTHFPASARIRKDPFGVSLIIGPWNYPFQLLMNPLVAAMGAGNTAIIKPSEFTVNTQNVIAKIINENFPEEYLKVFTGGIDTSTALLKLPTNFIFFTGGTNIGKIVMRAASEHLTPVALELGGKSPCIVDKEVNIKTAAKRITWAKFLNVGQTCVAPDYLYIHEDIEKEFINEMKKNVIKMYTDNPEKSDNYGRVVTEKHTERLLGLIDTSKGEVVIGGKGDSEKRYVEPTIIKNPDLSSKIMEEEIFGPVLLYFTYKNIEEPMNFIEDRPKPLAFYIFSNNSKLTERVITELSFGGGCVNDCILHLNNPELPFGGVGPSGMGNYHGKFGFDTFTHQKSILENGLTIDPPLRYAPYKESYPKLFKMVEKVGRIF